MLEDRFSLMCGCVYHKEYVDIYCEQLGASVLEVRCPVCRGNADRLATTEEGLRDAIVVDVEAFNERREPASWTGNSAPPLAAGETSSFGGDAAPPAAHPGETGRGERLDSPGIESARAPHIEG